MTSLRCLPVVPVEMLKRMTTRALLARLGALQALHESPGATDWDDSEIAAMAADGRIAFKDSAPWRAAYADLRRVLAQRPHAMRGGKAARQAAQQAKQKR